TPASSGFAVLVIRLHPCVLGFLGFRIGWPITGVVLSPPSRIGSMKGVVAAGHPATAEAGAAVLRDGGNAVDAAVAAVLMSFAAESPLTGPGAGGFMLVHTAAGEDHMLDFFVAAPGKGLTEVEPAALEPIDVHFSK